MTSEPLLTVRGLRVRRGSGNVLHDVNLDVHAGQVHALVGANGCGKSTLLDTIAGCLRPDRGRIRLNGVDITSLPPHAIARLGAGRTWQHPMICARLTVADNITLAAVGRPASGDALDLLGLHRHRDHLAGQLSYGQRRRLELAVALSAGARLLLLDEPSAGLSASDVRQLAAILRGLAPHVSALLADHHTGLIRLAAGTVTALTDGTAHPAAIPTRRPSPLPPAQSGAGEILLQANITAHPRLAAPARLSLRHGALTHITGPNGAGKTTLLHILAGVVATPRGSTIALAGSAVHHMPAHLRARAGITLLPQQRRLFTDLTVSENLRTARGATTAAVKSLAERFPQLTPVLGRKAGQLSGGQQQLVAFARAILTGPRLLLADEPLEGLDTAALKVVHDEIATLLARSGTVVVTEHRLDDDPG